MKKNELLPHALVTAMMFLTLLGTVGCMTRHQAVTSAAGDVAGIRRFAAASVSMNGRGPA